MHVSDHNCGAAIRTQTTEMTWTDAHFQLIYLWRRKLALHISSRCTERQEQKVSRLWRNPLCDKMYQLAQMNTLLINWKNICRNKMVVVKHVHHVSSCTTNNNKLSICLKLICQQICGFFGNIFWNIDGWVGHQCVYSVGGYSVLT